MSYAVFATDNSCGTITGKYTVKYFSIWYDVKPIAGISINEAYQLIEREINNHVKNCKCVFDVVDLES